jgi:3-hydroxyacyl-CoA dehydrogenase/enoyl-CoA hydratase/3-hydroxybutyryl-CoA epimerase
MMSNSIKREQHDDVVTLIFDQENSVANVFNENMFAELNDQLEYIENNQDVLRGVVFKSAKPSIFIAGADLKSFADDPTPDRISYLIKLGQDTFNRIEDLRITTVAAINGACLGGGYELALACDHRVATLDSSTKIGLPETMLGILPAWGGSTRLPRMIGIAGAMNIILAGKVVVPTLAYKYKMVDRVCHKENLDYVAKSYIHNGKKKYKKHTLNRFPLKYIAKSKATKNVLKTTGGVYPAPLKAIDVMIQGLGVSRNESLKLEEKAFTELLNSDVASNLVNIFFLQERSKKTKSDKDFKVNKTAVIGAGVMGAGIAQWISSRGIKVLLKDIKSEFVANGIKTISNLYSAAVKKRVMTKSEASSKLDNVTPITESLPMKTVDLVVEAAVEQLDIKQNLFAELETLVRDDTILATNTSALSIVDVAEKMEHKERVVGIHYFNPVHKMKLVEVVKGECTSEETVLKATQFVKKTGKLPVIVKDSPGFLVNRILMPYLIEAVHLANGGNDIEHTDKLLRKFGMPMGPFRLIDEVGGDVCQHVADDLLNRLNTKFPNSSLLRRMIEEGNLGKKSGQGFYKYSKGKSNGACDVPRNSTFRLQCENEEIVDRLILVMINEAVRCLEEEVVASPKDVDFGMIMGTGWAPFRGGPIRYLDSVGSKKIAERLQELAKKDAYFTPCDMLLEYAKTNKKFYEDK